MDRNEVIYKTFPHSLIGYDPIAVDAFLDEVIREFDRMNNTIDVLRFRLTNELGVELPPELAELPEGLATLGPKALEAAAGPGGGAEVIVEPLPAGEEPVPEAAQPEEPEQPEKSE